MLPLIAPPRVILPEVVTVPVSVNPLADPAPLTLVTVPPPAGVDQVPSPRQKVNADALVPEFRFVTGRLPVTCVDKLTPLKVPPSVRLPELVTVPVRVMPLTDPVLPTLVTVPLPLPLKVVQSVDVR